MGPVYDVNTANPELSTLVTPIIGKLCIHVQEYVGEDDFYIMPLPDCDVLIGIPWHYDNKALIDMVEKTITITRRGKKKVVESANQRGLNPNCITFDNHYSNETSYFNVLDLCKG